MSDNNESGGGIWILIVIGIGFALLLQSLGGGTGGSSRSASPASASAGVDRNTFGHRYATERLRQEGYSQSEAQQAADAIIKFHNAQQNRNR